MRTMWELEDELYFSDDEHVTKDQVIKEVNKYMPAKKEKVIKVSKEKYEQLRDWYFKQCHVDNGTISLLLAMENVEPTDDAIRNKIMDLIRDYIKQIKG